MPGSKFKLYIKGSKTVVNLLVPDITSIVCKTNSKYILCQTFQ